MKKSKKKAFQIVAALVLASAFGAYFITSGITTAYAKDIVIIGDAAGSLLITSDDTELFDLDGLYPGDTASSTITITNVDMVNEGFTVAMYAENTSDSQFDIGRVTNIRVTGGDALIYNGLLINFDENINRVTPINLGALPRGESLMLEFDIEVVGNLADNNYQGQESEFIVTFIVNSYGSPVAPPTSTPGTTEPFTPFIPSVPVAEVLSDDITPLAPVEQTIDIDDDDIPLSIFTPEEEPVEEEQVDVEDEDIPLGDIKEMPKTGEISLAVYLIFGVIIIRLGLFILIRKGEKSHEKENYYDS